MTIAYPVIIGQLGLVLVSLSDNIMVGALGAVPLAATSLANGIVFIALSLGFGFTFAITSLIAESDGEKNIKKGRTYFQHGVVLATVFGVILCLMLLLIKPVLYYMDQPTEVVELAIPYFEIISFSIIPLMIFQGLKRFTDGLSFTKYAMQATIISTIINILFNYVLIYGIWIFPRLEVVGAGYGTLFSRIVKLIFLVFIIQSKPVFKPYLQKFSLSEINKKVVKKIVNLGYPTALQMWFEVGIFSSGIFLAGVIGTNAQAANQIALNLSSMTYMVAVGLGVAASIRVGNQKGLKNYKELRRIGVSVFLLMMIIDLFFAVVFIVTRNSLPAIYIDDYQVIRIASILIIIAGFFQLADGIQATILGALRGLQDVKIPMLITFIAYWVVGFPICYYLGLYTELKAKGIWLGLLISLIVSAILLYVRFNKLTHKLIRNNKHL